jgi:hypothetical protein
MLDLVSMLPRLKNQIRNHECRIGFGHFKVEVHAEPGRNLAPSVEGRAFTRRIDRWRKPTRPPLPGSIPADALPTTTDPVRNVRQRQQILVNDAQRPKSGRLDRAHSHRDGIGQRRCLPVELSYGDAVLDAKSSVIAARLGQRVKLCVIGLMV